MLKVVFLDRDGVINKCAQPHEYISRWKDFTILPGVESAVSALNLAGYLVLVVTNQRGIARGLMTGKQVEEIHHELQEHLLMNDAHIDGFYVCPHNTGECHCRKPDIGLFSQAEAELNNLYKSSVDKSSSWMIGDSETDVEAGCRYGVRTILAGNCTEVQTQMWKYRPDAYAPGLREAVEIILKNKP